MKRYALLTLKILGGLLALLIVLMVAAAIILNTNSVQQKLLRYSTNLLREKLQTKVEIDSISVDFLTFDVNLMGLDVEDRQQRKMLQADKLALNVDLWDLAIRRLKISEADIEGVRARLYQPKDSAANYQFVIDAFKSDKPKPQKTDVEKKKKESKLTLDVSDLNISKIDVVFNEDTFYLEKLNYNKGWSGHQKGEIHHLQGKFDKITKKGELRTNRINLSQLILSEKGKDLMVNINGLRFSVDNHKPRKNVGKPHRGAFDVGHLDVLANMQMKVNYYGKDTANITMTKFTAVDSLTGFNVKDLRFTAGINKEKAYLSDITIQHENTVLKFDKGELTMPSKKAGRKLTYHTSEITGTTLLKDISKPFAPALANFTIPLMLKVKLSGTDSTMQFRDIHVNTSDQSLKIDADGGIDHLKSKELLDIHFHVKEMTTPSKTAIDIINQFTVKKFMMKQLKALGTIRYSGDIAILYKKEQFKGLLRTNVGNMTFNVAIDEKTKYVLGNVQTGAIHLGKVLEMKDIGNVACRANFTFDISKPRTAQVRKTKGGKLPIGKVNATVLEANYKKIKVKNIETIINSDGAIATGNLKQKNKNVDLLCDFSFTNTDSIHKMKILPNVKVHDIRLPWQKKDKQKQDPPSTDKSKKKGKKLWPFSRKS